MRALDLDTVWAQLHSSRARMLHELGCLLEQLLEKRSTAWEWFAESGITHHDEHPESGITHHDEHLPRLREWVDLLEIPE